MFRTVPVDESIRNSKRKRQATVGVAVAIIYPPAAACLSLFVRARPPGISSPSHSYCSILFCSFNFISFEFILIIEIILFTVGLAVVSTRPTRDFYLVTVM